MLPALQIWGGCFYLLNKIFFSRKERAQGAAKRRWQIAAWVVYLVGLPAWLILLSLGRNWIVVSVEAAGATSMILGLTIAIRGKGKEPRWLDYLALVAIVIGLGVSIYDFGGITSVNQWLELGLVTGFLLGTYRLARDNPDGYLWLVLMNGSCAVLMYLENYPWLFAQQIVSLGFVADAYVMQRKQKQQAFKE